MAQPAPDNHYAPLEVAVLYRATFAVRTDAYADWFAKPGCAHGEGCECHWMAVREELTPERVLAGLTAKRPVSTYMEDASGATHVGAIDFDRADGWALGLRVAAQIVAAGGVPYLERSRRGAHLWLILDDQLAGETVRLGLRHFVHGVDAYAARDPKVEIMPKRLESRGPETLGNPLRMPMMAHQKTGIRYPLCDASGAPIGASVTDVLLAVQYSAEEVLLSAAAAARVPISEVRPADWMKRPAQEGGNVVEILTAAGVDRVNPGRTVRCPLHDDRSASMVVSRDGERVWCKSPECAGFNEGRGLGAGQLASMLGGGVSG